MFREVLVSGRKEVIVLIQEGCRNPCLCLCCWDHLGTRLWWGKWRDVGLGNRTGGVAWWLSNAYEQRIFLNREEKNCFCFVLFFQQKGVVGDLS